MTLDAVVVIYSLCHWIHRLASAKVKADNTAFRLLVLLKLLSKTPNLSGG